jgi:hypothetical protein
MSQFGLVGDSFGTQLPQTEVAKELLADEKAKAKFSRTKEFAALKAHLEERIKFHKSYLPDGRPVELGMDNAFEVALNWQVANRVIGELQAVIEAYEQANEIVKEHGRQVR